MIENMENNKGITISRTDAERMLQEHLAKGYRRRRRRTDLRHHTIAGLLAAATAVGLLLAPGATAAYARPCNSAQIKHTTQVITQILEQR